MLELWLDSANPEDVRTALSWGVISGVTTNTTKILQTRRRFREVIDEICKLMGDKPVSVMAIESKYKSAETIVEEGKKLIEWHPNIVVKIPPTIEGIKAIRILSEMGIKTNTTLIYTPLQALLAAEAGATYVSPFVGRLDNIGYDGMELVRNLKTVFKNYGFKTKIVVAAVRHPVHVLKGALIGADIATMTLEILKLLYEHVLTDEGLRRFLEDWEKVPR